jgi:hypothetical protein
MGLIAGQLISPDAQTSKASPNFPLDRVTLILRQGVAEHSEGAEGDHHDAGHKPSCPHMPPHVRV